MSGTQFTSCRGRALTNQFSVRTMLRLFVNLVQDFACESLYELSKKLGVAVHLRGLAGYIDHAPT